MFSEHIDCSAFHFFSFKRSLRTIVRALKQQAVLDAGYHSLPVFRILRAKAWRRKLGTMGVVDGYFSSPVPFQLEMNELLERNLVR